jgi:hypothetical protein
MKRLLILVPWSILGDFCSSSTGDGTQGLVPARQVIYYLSSIPSPLFLFCFWDRVWLTSPWLLAGLHLLVFLVIIFKLELENSALSFPHKHISAEHNYWNVLSLNSTVTKPGSASATISSLRLKVLGPGSLPNPLLQWFPNCLFQLRQDQNPSCNYAQISPWNTVSPRCHFLAWGACLWQSLENLPLSLLLCSDSLAFAQLWGWVNAWTSLLSPSGNIPIHGREKWIGKEQEFERHVLLLCR